MTDPTPSITPFPVPPLVADPLELLRRLVRGGEEISSYPAQCTVSLERRTIPGEDSGTARAELQTILDRIAAKDPHFSAEIISGLERHPFEVGEDAPVVRTLAAAVEAETGTDRSSTRSGGRPPA